MYSIKFHTQKSGNDLNGITGSQVLLKTLDKRLSYGEEIGGNSSHECFCVYSVIKQCISADDSASYR